MTEPNGWTNPTGWTNPNPIPNQSQPEWPPPAYPTPPEAYPTPAPYPAVVNPYQNWGLSYLPGPVEMVVRRPPRPGVVSAAIGLVYSGIVLSAAEYTISYYMQWQLRDDLVAQTVDATNVDPVDATQLATTSMGIAIAIVAFVWLVVAASVVICAVLANRGRNGARITLAVILGILALANLCSAGNTFGSLLLAPDPPASEAFNSEALLPWWMGVPPVILVAVCVAAAVLLLIPPANRYFNAGAGRRFIPDR